MVLLKAISYTFNKLGYIYSIMRVLLKVVKIVKICKIKTVILQNNIHLQKVQIQPGQLFKQTKRSKTKQPAFEFTLLDSWCLEPHSWFVILLLPDPCDFKAEPGAKLPHILPTASWCRHPPSQWVIIIYFFIFIVNINNNIILKITNC